MRKQILKIFFLIAVLSIAPFSVRAADTVVTFPFSNSFNGTTLDPFPTGYSLEDLPNNSPWQGLSDNSTSAGHRGRITAGDNYSGGAGGMGYGHAIGDGHNDAGSGFMGLHHTTTNEMWGRFYVKYPLGFAWDGGTPYYQKIFYFYSSSYTQLLVLQWRDGTLGFMKMGDDSTNTQPYEGSGYDFSTWADVMGGVTGDGQWHCYEFHIKSGTAGNSVLETWIDNVQQMRDTSSTITGGWGFIEFFCNADSPANGGDMYISMDDVALSTTGRIGPLGSSDTIPPSAPQGLSVQ